MEDPIPTLLEVAVLMKVEEITLYTLARKRKTPAFKVCRQSRLKYYDIDRWVDEQETCEKRSAGESASYV